MTYTITYEIIDPESWGTKTQVKVEAESPIKALMNFEKLPKPMLERREVIGLILQKNNGKQI